MQYEQSNDGFYKMHTNLNSSTRYIHTDDFKGADIRCRLGSMKIYFDQANIQGNHADIYLDIELSSVELFFPKTWKIEKILISLCLAAMKMSFSLMKPPLLKLRLPCMAVLQHQD